MVELFEKRCTVSTFWQTERTDGRNGPIMAGGAQSSSSARLKLFTFAQSWSSISGFQCRGRSEIPNSKTQIPKKSQAPKFKGGRRSCLARFGDFINALGFKI